MVTLDLDEGRIGGAERHHAMSDLRDARVCNKGQLLGLSDPGARPDVPAVRQAIQVRQQGQGSKGAKAKEGGVNSDRVVLFMMLAQLALATVHGSSRDIKAGGQVFCIDVFLFQRNRVHEICQRGDRHSSFPSRLEAASGPDARQPAPSSAL